MPGYTREEKIAIANEILRQLGGGGRLKAMIGMHGQVALDSGLQFSFKGSRKYNKCIIRLDGSDTYTFELWQFSPKHLTCTLKYTNSGVYNDMLVGLFESLTGLYLSLGTMGR
jgi:hypothetical protein